MSGASQDSEALVQALKNMIADADIRKRMGLAARQRAIQEFDASIVNQQLAHKLTQFYQERFNHV